MLLVRIVILIILIENIPEIKDKFLICLFTLRKVGGGWQKREWERIEPFGYGKEGKEYNMKGLSFQE